MFGSPRPNKTTRRAEKAISQVRNGVRDVLSERLTVQEAGKLASLLSEGTWTHDYPLFFQMAKDLGLPVSSSVPVEVLELMKLFPQPVRHTPSVEYLPVPRRSDEQKTNGRG